MWTSLKNLIYELIVRSHIIFYILPVMKSIFGTSIMKKAETELLTDEGGSSMRVTKLNGKIYPAFGKNNIAKVKDVRVREDDVFLCGYPKTGCHWVFEILQMLVNNRVKLSKLGKGPGGMVEAMPNLILDSIPSRRVLNSHVIYEELPKGIKENKTKIILTVRSPKDTVVSYYNHVKSLNFFYEYDGLFENLFKMFMKGEMEYGDYFDYYVLWTEAMKTQNDNAIFLLEFEELKKDPSKKILEMAKFLDIPITTEFAEEIAKASTFNNMKKKYADNKLLRKGTVGDWKNWLTDDQASQIDKKWEETLKMKGFTRHN